MAIRKREGPLPDDHPYKGVSIASANSPLVVGLRKLRELEKQKALESQSRSDNQSSQPLGEEETEADWLSGPLNGQRVARMQHQNRSLRRSQEPQESEEQPDPTQGSSE